MKYLLLALLLTSCGYVKVPLFEEHMDDEHEDSSPRRVEVSQALVVNCNAQAFNNRCTLRLVYDRALFNNELFNNYCLMNYRQCVKR